MSATRVRRSFTKPLAVSVLAAALLVPVNAYAAQAAARPASAAAAAAAPAAPAAAPIVVRPGQKLDIGHGMWLTLTAAQVCTGDSTGVENCSSVTNGNQAPGSVSLETSGDTTGTLYRALYLGSGAARMTVEDGADNYRLRLVTLPGHPGYAVGFGWGAPQASPTAKPGAQVYDAAGKLLASL